MSLLESELLFLNSEAGEYELEGDIASTHLPTSLSQSIRLRLAKVEERDAALDLVLKLCACMGGSMTLASAEAVWALLLEQGTSAAKLGVEREPVAQVLQRGARARLLKFLAASGVRSLAAEDQAGERRCSSSAAGASNKEGLWAFHHLRAELGCYKPRGPRLK